jgi:aspartyl/glutamyl-tRNA(asn/gln) amidotransferase, C subunit
VKDMKVSKEEIIHMAKLSDLNLSEEEIEKYTLDMEDILEFANTINKVNTDGLEEMMTVGKAYNVFRKDEIKEFGNRDALLQNAEEVDRGMFKIPKVIG